MTGSDQTDSTCEPKADSTGSNTTAPSSSGREPLVRKTLGLLSENRLLVVPFFIAGLVGAGTTVAVYLSPLPVVSVRFPDHGLVQLSPILTPMHDKLFDILPGFVSGLRPAYFLSYVGLQLVFGATAAVSIGAGFWVLTRDLEDGVSQSITQFGWLSAYLFVLTIPVGPVLMAFLGGQATIGIVFLILMAWVVGVVIVALLFLTPAFLLIENAPPHRAMHNSVRCVRKRPITITAITLTLGYVQYVATGVGSIAPAEPVGYALSSLSAITIVGPIYVATVFAVYLALREPAHTTTQP